MLRFRTGSLALVCVAALGAACTKSSTAPATAGRSTTAPGPTPAGAKVLGTFTGSYDATTGALTIAPAAAEGEPGALTVYQPTQDGTAGSGPANTFELVTERDPELAPSIVPDGCGSTASFGAYITLRSFYETEVFWNAYIELTEVTTGNEACNGDAAFADLSTSYGLWRYGTLEAVTGAPRNAATVPWRFNYPAGQDFSFKGRIVAMPGPTFDWTPASIATPAVVTTTAASFKVVPTTTAHIVWNPSTANFEDQLGRVTFARFNAANPAVDTTIAGLGQSYGDFYANYIENQPLYIATGGAPGNANRIDTSGDFTVCARFKPGAHPGTSASKVLVAKGRPQHAVETGGRGWALVQTFEYYALRYKYPNGENSREEIVYQLPGWDNAVNQTTTPEIWAYDYVCGGRNGSKISVNPHGRWITELDGTVAIERDYETQLALVIAGYEGAPFSRYDGGVYEIIFDSRPATREVMNEIVSAAEGRTLANGVTPASGNPSQTLWQPFWASTTAIGLGGNEYTLAPYMTKPPAVDGSGRLMAGNTIQYTRPFTDSTLATGYCFGAAVNADAGWWNAGGTGWQQQALVQGLVVQFGGDPTGYGLLSRSATLYIGEYGFTFSGWISGVDFAVNADGFANWSTLAAGSHKLMACLDANTATTPKVSLYIDGASAGTPADFKPNGSGGFLPAFDAGEKSVYLGIGNKFTGSSTNVPPLSGGKIERVMFCPSSNPLLCP